MNTWNRSIAYFSREDLQCRCCMQLRLDISVAVNLPILRAQWGDALHIGVGCLCDHRNAFIGGHPDSLHLVSHPQLRYDEVEPMGTMAVTLRWAEWNYPRQLELARMAFDLGWSVGLHRAAISIDRRADVGMGKIAYYGDDWHFDFRKEHVAGASIARSAANA